MESFGAIVDRYSRAGGKNGSLSENELTEYFQGTDGTGRIDYDRSNEQIIIEILMLCGQFPIFSKLSTRLEEVLDDGVFRKSTFLAYEYKKFDPKPAGRQRPPEDKARQPRDSELRFSVSLSFSGEDRNRVREVAMHLESKLGKERVLYDEFHRADLMEIRLSTRLQNLYRYESELVVAFLCEGYDEGEWTGVEWDAILDMIQLGESEKVTLITLDDVDVSSIRGIYKSSGHLKGQNLPPDDLANLILERLSLVQQTR